MNEVLKKKVGRPRKSVDPESQQVQKTLAREVVRRIERKGVPVAELARQMGVSRQAVYKLMRGERWPTPQVMLSLCRALECKVSELFACMDPLA